MFLKFDMKTKKIRANESKILSIAFVILMLTACAFVITDKTVSAQSLSTISTQTFMSLSPNPAGVNQAVTVFVWSSLEPFEYGTTFWGWNMTVTVTSPSGVATTIALPETLSTGYTYISYTPTTTGTYQFQANFPAVVVNVPTFGVFGISPGDYAFTASQSSVQTLNVTTQEVLPWPETSLPTGYWQIPITAENHNWYSLAGNWLNSGVYNGGTPTTNQGPISPHILWTKPLSFGGLSGGTIAGSEQRAGNTYGLNYYNGLLYENKLKEWIINDYMFYDINPPGSMFVAGLPGVNCVNLRTGELVWQNLTMPQITCAQVYTISAGLMSGSQAFLWSTSGTTWYQYDAFTGTLITSYTDVASTMGAFGPSAVGLNPIYGPSGEILVYILNGAGHWFALWNSTIAVQYPITDASSQNYQPSAAASRPWSNGIQWNVTIPTVAGSPSASIYDYPDGVLVAEASFNTNTVNPTFEDVGYSLTTGEQLWVANRTNVGWGQGGPTVPGLFTFGNAFGNGYYAFFERETLQWHIINIKTGIENAVTPALNTVTGNDWSYYDWSGQIAYGALYTTGYSGDVCAFNVTTGTSMWVFSEGSSGVQTPFGSWPTYGGVTIANGIIYYGPLEHTPPTPMYRGFNLYAINATTGEQMWSLPAFMASLAVAGGELVGYNGYDNQIYALGTGRSATTVEVLPALNSASQVVITGTVTDQSPGDTSLGIPAAGTPAISDDSMSAWMAYLYQQQPEPMNATGVQVTLTAIDPNGNLQNIGPVTTDITGHYGLMWTPPVPGYYKVTATFAGSNSYYSSSAETVFGVGATTLAAPAATSPTATVSPTQTAAPTSTPVQSVSPSPSVAPQPTSGMPTTTYISIAAAVVIIAVLAAVIILRKRK